VKVNIVYVEPEKANRINELIKEEKEFIKEQAKKKQSKIY
jgi:vacuolar-type H+-ATPase subunit E/Vma4